MQEEKVCAGDKALRRETRAKGRVNRYDIYFMIEPSCPQLNMNLSRE